MNHIRYVLYWEAYENNPSLFLQELEDVVNIADKWGLKIIHDNHQYHTILVGLMKKEEQDFLPSYLIKVFILLIQA